MLAALVMLPADGVAADPAVRGAFFIQALGNRCVDFGGQASWTIGSAVFIYSCNGSVAQQVRLVELDTSHDVHLQVPTTSLCIGVRGGVVAPDQPLELQTCATGVPSQRFALDGDAILMGMQGAGIRVSREYVIEPAEDHTALRTPLVVGTREVSDAEYFRFRAADGSAGSPTTGFTRVTTDAELHSALNKGWGTVIEVQGTIRIDARVGGHWQIPAGITLRGYRKLTDNGPEIYACDTNEGVPAFRIDHADQVRMTGLRLHGPIDDPRCDGGPLPGDGHAIQVYSSGERVLIDHVESSHWTGHALDVHGPGGVPAGGLETCPERPPLMPRQTPVRAIGNFLHHNVGYGVVSGEGSFVLMQGNVTAYRHAHSFASDSKGDTGYAAYDNFLLRKTIQEHVGHDFDVHGGFNIPGQGSWEGGAAGDYFDIGWNTILATDHLNLLHRGTPCRDGMRFHDNVLLRSESESVKTLTTDLSRHHATPNFYSSPDPTSDLDVGDFDGDGIDDVFVGTGAGWYFSSGGEAEWRFLNRMHEHASELLFGDFDGDRRTDVLALHGANIDVSWAGGTRWQTINVTARALIDDLAVGDFDGDGNADLFLATGNEWFRAPGGRNWAHFAFSSFRTKDLAFGNFTAGDRITDVLGSVSGKWQIVANGGTTWQPLGPARTNSLAGLAVGDFDGHSLSDLARTSLVSQHIAWQFSSGGDTPWKVLRAASQVIEDQPVGRFDGDAFSDVILWHDLYFDYAPSGRDPVQRHSRQNMR